MDYTITLTETEKLAMEYVAADVDEWITNAAINRANAAIEEICNIYMNQKLQNNEPITAVGKEAMVAAAFEEGIVISGLQRKLEQEVELNKMLGIEPTS